MRGWIPVLHGINHSELEGPPNIPPFFCYFINSESSKEVTWCSDKNERCIALRGTMLFMHLILVFKIVLCTLFFLSREYRRQPSLNWIDRWHQSKTSLDTISDLSFSRGKTVWHSYIFLVVRVLEIFRSSPSNAAQSWWVTARPSW